MAAEAQQQEIKDTKDVTVDVKKLERDLPTPPTLEELRDIEIHGLFSWYRSNTTKERVFWSIILLKFFTILLYELMQTFKDYLEHPILTTCSAAAKSSMEFPDVYVCPSNFINQTKLDIQGTLQPNSKWLEIYWAYQSQLYPSLLGQIATPWEPFGSDLNKQFASMQEDPPLQLSPPTVSKMQEYFMDVGYDLDQFMKECAFGGEIVNCNSIATPIFDRDHGKCFLINMRDVNQVTPGLGLRLVLDANTHLYSKRNQTPFDGAYVFIERRFEPTVTKKILAPTGTFTRVSLEVMETEFINYQYRGFGQKCTEQENAPKSFKVMNTPTLCQMDCVQDVVLELCNCLLAVDQRFLRNDIFAQKGGPVIFCDAQKLKNCVYDSAYKKEASVIKACYDKCDIMCHTFEYKLYVSSLNFPSKSLKNDSKYDKCKSDYILIDVSFDEMHVVQVTQHKAMTFDTFVGNVGGQLGLWFGMSLLTIVQAIVLLIRYCRYKCLIYYVEKSKSN